MLDLKQSKDILTSLSDEAELEKAAALPEKEVKDALEQGRQDRVASESSAKPVPDNSRMRYR